MSFTAGAHAAIGQLHSIAETYRQIGVQLRAQPHTAAMHAELTEAAAVEWSSPAAEAYRWGIEGVRVPVSVTEHNAEQLAELAGSIAEQLTQAAQFATEVSLAVQAVSQLSLLPDPEQLASAALWVGEQANEALESAADFMQFSQQYDGVLRTLRMPLTGLHG